MERAALQMIDDSGLDDSTLQRIESGKQYPKLTTLKALMKRLELPLNGLVYSPGDYLDMELYSLRDRMNQALERGDTAEAEEVMLQIEKHPGLMKISSYNSNLARKHTYTKLWESRLI